MSRRARRDAAPKRLEGTREALVVGVLPGLAQVEVEGERVPAILGGEEVVVGDRVRVAPGPTGRVAIRARLERRTTLSRPDPSNRRREQAIAANVDRGVIVAAIRMPPLRVGLVDRLVLALERGGIAPVVALNKSDLASPPERAEARAALAAHAGLGVPIVECSATTGEGVDDLRDAIRGLAVVFVGHSGVGKSSLVSALVPDLHVETGAVRAFDGKGRHTTTVSSLVSLEDGTRIVDTPGIRELGLWRIDATSLAALFEDFAACGPCRFRDCAHVEEADCAVRAAAAGGTLSRARYEAYLRIRATLE